MNILIFSLLKPKLKKQFGLSSVEKLTIVFAKKTNKFFLTVYGNKSDTPITKSGIEQKITENVFFQMAQSKLKKGQINIDTIEYLQSDINFEQKSINIIVYHDNNKKTIL